MEAPKSQAVATAAGMERRARWVTPQNDDHNSRILRLVEDTGSRAGDLANLKWSSVDMERKTISFGQRQTKRFVEIPIHAELERWLVEEFKQRPNAEFVFPKFAGKPIGSRGGISGQYPLLVKKAGLANLITCKSRGPQQSPR